MGMTKGYCPIIWCSLIIINIVVCKSKILAAIFPFFFSVPHWPTGKNGSPDKTGSIIVVVEVIIDVWSKGEKVWRVIMEGNVGNLELNGGAWYLQL